MNNKEKIEEFKPLPIEVIHKEIDLIQDIIKRMSQNSFFIKGWAIALTAATLVFVSKFVTIHHFAFVGLSIALLALWALDALYLKNECLYRKWYDFCIINSRHKTCEWKYQLNAKNINQIMKDVPIKHINDKVPSYLKCFLNKTLTIFYIGLLALSIAAAFI